MVGILAAGALGGLLGAAAMGALMRTVMRGKPLPSEVFAAQFLFDGDPMEHPYWGLTLHLLYGTALGAAFGPATTLVLGSFPASVVEAVTWGAGWGVALWIVSFGWLEVLGTLDRIMEMPSDERMAELAMIFVGHLVYGGVLGYVAFASVTL